MVKNRSFTSRLLAGLLLLGGMMVAGVIPSSAQAPSFAPCPPPSACPPDYQGLGDDNEFSIACEEFENTSSMEVSLQGIYVEGFRGWRSLSFLAQRRDSFFFGHRDGRNPQNRAAVGSTNRIHEFRPFLVPAGTSEQQRINTYCGTGQRAAVDVSLSLGDLQQVAMPDVIGLTRDEAETAIQNANLSIRSITSISSAIPAGTVLEQSPPAGIPVNELSSVELTVSLGGLEIVPDVTGRTESAAASILTSEGLVVGTITQQHSATVATGNVISQSPAAGSEVNTGTAVNLVISPGRPPTTNTIMPNLAGFTQAEATLVLQNAGLVVGGVFPIINNQVPPDTVAQQFPVAGVSTLRLV